MRPERPGALAALLGFGLTVAAGGAVGTAWALLAPRERVRVSPEGTSFLARPEEAGVAADAWFGVCGAGAGFLTAALAFAMMRRTGPLLALTWLVVAGVLGSLVAWRVGVFLGPAPVEQQVREAAQRGEFERPVTVTAYGVLLAWPLVGVATFFAGVLGFGPADLRRSAPDGSAGDRSHESVRHPHEVRGA